MVVCQLPCCQSNLWLSNERTVPEMSQKLTSSLPQNCPHKCPIKQDVHSHYSTDMFFSISNYRLEITYGCLSTASLSTQPLTLKRKKWWPFKWVNLDPNVRLVTNSPKPWTNLELLNPFWPGPNSKPISSWAKNKLPRKLTNWKALPNLKMPTMLEQSKSKYFSKIPF